MAAIKTIGFIGVGNMGGPMAQNLLKAGHALRVYDLAPAALDAAKAAGASRPDRARDSATRAAGRRMGGIEAPARNKRKHFFLMNPGPGGPSSNRPQKHPGTDSSAPGPGLVQPSQPGLAGLGAGHQAGPPAAAPACPPGPC